MPQAKRIEYMCSYCGKRVNVSASSGRPAPGFCTRKPKDRNGNFKPHTWVVSRKFY